jgi:hypothetical protein
MKVFIKFNLPPPSGGHDVPELSYSGKQKFPKLYKRMEDEGEDMGKIYKRAVFPLSPKIFFVFEVRG